uniref:Uncharacterized protein n=1 Tax=Rousettus aegyptiacus TaxID=9407 RepID=A0A7J8HS10_ROUAE|nr:hypothetical protein HJG63_010859 [Rousettus aegyptiacus]
MLLGSWEWPRGQCAEPEGEAREGRQWQAGSLLVWLELLAFPFQAPEESSVTHLLHSGNEEWRVRARKVSANEEGESDIWQRDDLQSRRWGQKCRRQALERPRGPFPPIDQHVAVTRWCDPSLVPCPKRFPSLEVNTTLVSTLVHSHGLFWIFTCLEYGADR